jgi:arylformamidase
MSDENTEQYLTGQMRPHHPALLAAFQTESDAAVVAWRPDIDVRYGPHPRQTFDFFKSPKPGNATLAWFHAGYWQARDKAQFRFLAPGLLDLGIDVAMVNYPLCPEVDLPALTDAARGAVPAILTHAATLGRGGRSLIAAGHSAGAHLAVELALTDWRAFGLADPPISAVLGVSGVYDLTPLIGTPLNVALRLDAETARACSPVHRVVRAMPPALFVVGGAETPAFPEQNERMRALWAKAGNRTEALVVAGADHFTLLRDVPEMAAALSVIV